MGLCLVFGAVPARAQQAGRLSAYLLNVGLWSDAGVTGDAGVLDLQRIRFMAAPRAGSWRLDLAWETLLILSSRSDVVNVGGMVGAPSSAAWLPLQGTLLEGRDGSWRHRADRLALDYAAPGFEVTAGRQAISWATTLLFTPADPFAPFDPSDPFREYRAGVDALRARVTLGAFTDVDGVARVADTPVGRRLTLAVRGRTLVRGVELSGWGGAVSSRAAGALGVTATAHGAVMRGEIVVRDESGKGIVRGAVGVDRSWEIGGRTLTLALEYQRDGFGAASAAELPGVVLSAPAARGELQALGRDEIAVQGRWQLHPLVGLELLGVHNLGDRSTLLAPAATWSASRAITVRGGAFVGAGRAGAPLAPGSEYGVMPTALYLSASAFF